MEGTLTAIELNGIVNEQHQLQVDQLLPISGPKKVRVIVLYASDTEWNEGEWLRAASRDPAFDYLKESTEDIYSVNDGQPFNDKV